MSTTDINNIIAQCRYLFGLNPSVTCSRVSSGGNLGSISDTRTQAGASTSDVTNFHTAAETGNVSTVTVNQARIMKDSGNTTAPADTSNVAFPCYQTGNNIRAMTITDMYDTFIYPAINILINGSDQPGTYRIHSGTSLSGHTLVSSSPVFSDTRANVGAYTAGGIGETRDQPFTVANWYLMKTNAGSATGYTSPIFIRASDNNIQQFTAANFNTQLSALMRHAASAMTGHRITYNLNGSGSNRGSGMTNTKVNGSGNHQTRYVNTDDYRTQEFPNGTAVVVGTTFLRITQN